ncbi:MAG: transcription termination factor Rho [Candidatus Woykebacteria bacterium RIFCSPLOWO2_01_FULL_41_12]|uniref:Transcription termination factor Rho n=1 Tax=Candidatus Woykebacteria bacterium RIFCSPLOWO2_01_FULL_41_12 TaxID=1802604 RepID=A0A1G1WWV5_9BACT|nr:MAG: transcription termination factor Rho [Candidatus Woykebacteria bacterium RIFCSPLOWO2_01_FULL_41_12]
MPRKKEEKIEESQPVAEKTPEPSEKAELPREETVQPEPSFGPIDYRSGEGKLEVKKGVLEVMPEGYGFLRANGLQPGSGDIYISQSQIRRFDIRPGDEVEGEVRPPKETERYYGMLKVSKVNGMDAEKVSRRPRFESLTPVYPDKQLKLETGKDPVSTRMIDLLAPIGYGQRGMVVSPPKAGKTTVLKEIANGVSTNYPDVHLMAVLIGERPEEVTDITRSIKGEVHSSNFDDPPEHQTRVAELSLERAKRLVETGKDVFILLDSITRLGRAYNLALPPSGRTLTGGFDPVALYPPKKFFGAARNLEGGGSLTIIATALVDTGSRMDDLIYEEFKGTGNMELHLDRGLSERRIFPSIDVSRSGTRNEELLIDAKTLQQIWRLRRMLDTLNEVERTDLFLERLTKTASNKDFLETLHKEIS